MTQIEMLSGLAQDMRDLRKLININNEHNHDAHVDLLNKLAKVEKLSGINGTKIAFITGVATILSAGIVSVGIAFVG